MSTKRRRRWPSARRRCRPSWLLSLTRCCSNSRVVVPRCPRSSSASVGWPGTVPSPRWTIHQRRWCLPPTVQLGCSHLVRARPVLPRPRPKSEIPRRAQRCCRHMLRLRLAMDHLPTPRPKWWPALSSSAPTQVHVEGHPGGEPPTRVTVALDNQDPETLRPEDAQQAAEHARRSAKTKLVAVIPTMFAPPPPPPQPTLIESEGSSLLRQVAAHAAFYLARRTADDGAAAGALCLAGVNFIADAPPLLLGLVRT
jgi:hypothetical protein